MKLHATAGDGESTGAKPFEANAGASLTNTLTNIVRIKANEPFENRRPPSLDAAQGKKATDLFSARMPSPKTSKDRSAILPFQSCMAEFSGGIVGVRCAHPAYGPIDREFPATSRTLLLGWRRVFRYAVLARSLQSALRCAW